MRADGASPSLNFARHFVALRRLTLRPYKQDPEAQGHLRAAGRQRAAASRRCSTGTAYLSELLSTSLRHAAFNVISMATTTGFVTQDFEKWPVFAPIWMLFLSCIVCSTGSTGGGIKMFRTLLLARQAGRELKLLVHPSAVWPVRIGGKPIPDRVGDSVLAFIFLYFMTVVALTFALLLTGLDFDSSFSAVVASINNAGPGPRRGRARRTTIESLTRRADLDLHRCHAARAPRDLQRPGAVHARVLAQVDGCITSVSSAVFALHFESQTLIPSHGRSSRSLSRPFHGQLTWSCGRGYSPHGLQLQGASPHPSSTCSRGDVVAPAQDWGLRSGSSC